MRDTASGEVPSLPMNLPLLKNYSIVGGAFDALPPGGLVLVHDFMVENVQERPAFAAWYLLGSVFDNPNAVCLTPSYVERVLKRAGFRVEGTEAMLAGITMLTRALKPV
jgi:hypothetical protein